MIVRHAPQGTTAKRVLYAPNGAYQGCGARASVLPTSMKAKVRGVASGSEAQSKGAAVRRYLVPKRRPRKEGRREGWRNHPRHPILVFLAARARRNKTGDECNSSAAMHTVVEVLHRLPISKAFKHDHSNLLTTFSILRYSTLFFLWSSPPLLPPYSSLLTSQCSLLSSSSSLPVSCHPFPQL